ncbi:hypothetical protein SXCC_03328 [Gluconacetobacter sp. SXCC-1]|nr:hypothetical protein SXCC_03328 [Gluconacetobacter sp. SXCC-1]
MPALPPAGGPLRGMPGRLCRMLPVMKGALVTLFAKGFGECRLYWKRRHPEISIFHHV